MLIPYISNGPLIFWMYPVFGIRGASSFLGVSEWLFGALLFLGFWNKKLGILGALGSCVTFVMTVMIIPFMPMAGPRPLRAARYPPIFTVSPTSASHTTTTSPACSSTS